ncbi:hypothetical protein, partial [Blastomonas fulva]|uniref:hypothetical protein n=1 Tax=Blastomonas fulva TaxID=1550728 RepID=UPI004033C6C3
VASLCAFLIQGRIQWWDAPWLGYAASVHPEPGSNSQVVSHIPAAPNKPANHQNMSFKEPFLHISLRMDT